VDSSTVACWELGILGSIKWSMEMSLTDIFAVVFACIALLACLNVIGYRIFGRVVKGFVESLDELFLGVDVHMKTLDVSLVRGRLNITGLKIDNPPGFYSEYALQAQNIRCDLDMWSVIRSCGRLIRFKELVFEQIDVNMEMDGRPSCGDFDFESASSNLGILTSALAVAETRQEVDESTRKFYLERVVVKDIFGVVTHKKSKLLRVQLALSDINYEDFHESHGTVDMYDAVRIIVHELLSSVVKTALTNLGGRKFASVMTNPRRCCDY